MSATPFPRNRAALAAAPAAEEPPARPRTPPRLRSAADLTPSLFDQAVCAIGLILLWDALLSVLMSAPSQRFILRAGGAPESSGDTIKQLIFAGLYATALLRIVMLHGVRAFRYLSIPMALMVVLALASSQWSHDPSLTIRRSVALIGTTIFGLYAGLSYGEVALARLIHRAVFVLAVLSALLAVGLPSYGLMPAEQGSQWRGVFSHKNGLGDAMAFGLTAGLFVLRSRPVTDTMAMVWRLGTFAVMAGCLAMSGSATALIVAMAGMTLVMLVTHRQDAGSLAIELYGGIMVIMLAAIFAILNLETIVTLLGRDITLTGRTLIWEFAFGMIEQQPVLGYGFSAFWSGLDAPGALFWRTSGRFDIHAHNGFIQTTLDVGLLGIGLFLVAYVIYLSRIARIVPVDRSGAARWHIVFAMMLLLANIAESSLLVQNGLLWFLFTAFQTRLSKTVHAHALTPRPEPGRRPRLRNGIPVAEPRS